MAFQSNFSISSILGQENETVNANQDNSSEISNPDRPKYSYNSLIMMAIKASPNGRLTLAEIYEYIKHHYEYYKNCQTGWQNTIRHSLSVSGYFIRTPRAYDEPGRGGYWSLSPKAEKLFLGSSTGRLQQPSAMNGHYVPAPHIPVLTNHYVNCVNAGCMCYQFAGITPQMLQEYFHMQQVQGVHMRRD
ncbi:unnamed protein product [Hermetia illucens]|uniref:Fork-head domain-containing protein n=1 Tax=Hermetia illucens TaxID=343691 RepID=A0A7R8UER6_HERIL|nr:fork head domain transcription factor slp2-like [Hermetia illucens]CAD7079362.1 unnamed protein product [Hermetia illucens]